MKIKTKVADSEGLDRILTRIAHEILEKNKGSQNLILMGMRTRGEFLARRIQNKLKTIDNADLPLGVLDVTLYRDDFRMRIKQPEVSVSDITFDINEKHIILVDDVLYTGRTVRAALDAMIAFGRPAKVELLVLVDRTNTRDLPIAADYVGKLVNTIESQRVLVELEGQGYKQNRIWLINKS